MVTLEPDFSQFFIGTFCITGIIVLIILFIGVAMARLIWGITAPLGMDPDK